MQIKLTRFSVLPFKSMKDVIVQRESKYKVSEKNIRDFYCDVIVDFTVPFLNLGKENDEFTIIRASYTISDVPSDNKETKKAVVNVAINEMKRIMKEFTIQMTIDRNLNIVDTQKEDIDFFNEDSTKNNSYEEKEPENKEVEENIDEIEECEEIEESKKSEEPENVKNAKEYDDFVNLN